MSGVCIINLKKHNLTFEKINELAEKLMFVALQNHVAVFFHSNYRKDIIESAKMQNYFVMSDSFVYRNCNFLETNSIIEKLYLNNAFSYEEFHRAFKERSKFFNEIIDNIFQYDVSLIEIYISGSGCVSSANDFELRKTSTKNFLLDLFSSLQDYENDYNYEFSNVKFELRKDVS